MPANLRPRRVAALVVVLAACAARPASLSAQTYLVLHSLSVSSGNSPQSSLVQDAGGKLYGTAALSGAHGSGSIFKLDTNGDNFVDIHDSDNTDGANPYGGVILGGGGFLFGTAANGGNDDAGVVYKIDTSGNNFAVIHHLDGGNDGSHPFGGLAPGLRHDPLRRRPRRRLERIRHRLLDRPGLYGTTAGGVAHGVGTIWRLTTPSVVSIAPDSGPAGGGTQITITGSGFANQATVALSGSFATNVGVVNDTTIRDHAEPRARAAPRPRRDEHGREHRVPGARLAGGPPRRPGHRLIPRLLRGDRARRHHRRLRRRQLLPLVANTRGHGRLVDEDVDALKWALTAYAVMT